MEKNKYCTSLINKILQEGIYEYNTWFFGAKIDLNKSIVLKNKFISYCSENTPDDIILEIENLLEKNKEAKNIDKNKKQKELESLQEILKIKEDLDKTKDQIPVAIPFFQSEWYIPKFSSSENQNYNYALAPWKEYKTEYIQGVPSISQSPHQVIKKVIVNSWQKYEWPEIIEEIIEDPSYISDWMQISNPSYSPVKTVIQNQRHSWTRKIKMIKNLEEEKSYVPEYRYEEKKEAFIEEKKDDYIDLSEMINKKSFVLPKEEQPEEYIEQVIETNDINIVDHSFWEGEEEEWKKNHKKGNKSIYQSLFEKMVEDTAHIQDIPKNDKKNIPSKQQISINWIKQIQVTVKEEKTIEKESFEENKGIWYKTENSFWKEQSDHMDYWDYLFEEDVKPVEKKQVDSEDFEINTIEETDKLWIIERNNEDIIQDETLTEDWISEFQTNTTVEDDQFAEFKKSMAMNQIMKAEKKTSKIVIKPIFLLLIILIIIWLWYLIFFTNNPAIKSTFRIITRTFH